MYGCLAGLANTSLAPQAGALSSMIHNTLNPQVGTLSSMIHNTLNPQAGTLSSMIHNISCTFRPTSFSSVQFSSLLFHNMQLFLVSSSVAP